MSKKSTSKGGIIKLLQTTGRATTYQSVSKPTKKGK